MPAIRDACIQALIHFDQSTGAFINSGNRGGAMTAFGSGSSVSSASKFGGYCYVGPTSTYGGVSTPSNIERPGDALFMLSAWVYLTAYPSGTPSSVVWVGQTVPSPAIAVFPTGIMRAIVSNNGNAQYTLDSASVIPLNQWVHLETHRGPGNVWRVLINGVVVGTDTATLSGISGQLGVSTLDVGGQNGNTPFTLFGCRIDEVIYMRGLTDHEGAFTPETAAYVNPDPFGAVGLARPASLQAFPPTWPARAVGLTPPPPVYRAYWGGLGRIVGTTKIKGTPNTPVRRRVRLIREVDAVCVGERWSDPVTGAYAFNGFDPLQLYTVIVYDGPRVFRAAVQDAVVPEVYTP